MIKNNMKELKFSHKLIGKWKLNKKRNQLNLLNIKLKMKIQPINKKKFKII